jgi:hypothetical protein
LEPFLKYAKSAFQTISLEKIAIFILVLIKAIYITSFFGLLFLTSCVKEEPQTNNSNGGPVLYPSVSAEMQTNFSEDWDNWRFYLGDTTIQLFTAFSEDWDNWDFSTNGLSGDLFTNFSNDWDNWKLTSDDYTITIKTSFSEDWDNWDITDGSNNWHADVTTSFSEDWDNWDAYDDGHFLDMQTAFSEDFDNWDVYGAFPASYPTEYRIAILFVPVIVNILKIQGVIS